MRKETNLPVTVGAVVAELGAVAGGMEPVLKDIVSIWAVVSKCTGTFLFHAWAGDAGVVVEARVATTRLLLGVSVGAFGPVVSEPLAAWHNLYMCVFVYRERCVVIREGGCQLVGSSNWREEKGREGGA